VTGVQTCALPISQKILRKFKIFGTEEDNIKDEQEEIRKKEEEA
jgi:hypothetical protein